MLTGKKLAKLGVVLNVNGLASSHDSLYCAKKRWEHEIIENQRTQKHQSLEKTKYR